MVRLFDLVGGICSTLKATSTYRPEHVRAMRVLAERLGDRFLGGAVLGLSTERYLLGDRIWGLPVATLWEHD